MTAYHFRRRQIYAALILLIVFLGLGIRSAGGHSLLSTYAPDTLWAMLVFVLIAVIAPRWPGRKVALAALTFAYAIECSQLYHAPWIDAVRATHAGELVLGFGFLWSDLVCYMAGVVLGLVVDLLIWRSQEWPRLEMPLEKCVHGKQKSHL